ncbi:hypothetical protein Dda_3663 [Drechslerella dactyloides]|uniref:LisH domain-containing protein n=1 Tax=Drechslerella dactyloides TaxID=74499 RepID=A0AAD6IYD1_DREDA|nr:hypothetical protein Dda_3663 [Drechslerella dactyloides]
MVRLGDEEDREERKYTTTLACKQYEADEAAREDNKMPAGDSPDVLVARFLLANNYHETFAAFTRETNLTPDSITTAPTDLTIEKILQEKKLYDLAVRFEKLHVDAAAVAFAVPYPSEQTTLTTASTTSNILSITLSPLLLAGEDAPHPAIIATSADKYLRIYSARTPYPLLHAFPSLHSGPILSVLVISHKWLLTSSMAGDIAVSSLTGAVQQRWQGHAKFVVKLALSDPLPTPPSTEESGEGGEVRYLAAASYDKTFSIHKLHISTTGPPRLEYLHSLPFETTVEDVLFSKDFAVDNPSPSPLLIATLRDSTYLHIFTTPPPPSSSSTSTTGSAATQQHRHRFRLQTKAPLTATLTTWLTYTPTSLTRHPSHPHVIALLTSSLPSPKLLLYNLQTHTVDSAITVPVSLAPFSTGVVAWRGDAPASGIWVNGDDGVVKGVEIKSGEVKAELTAHEGRKVRCLVAGSIVTDEEEEEEEILVSGGFDGALKVWRVPKDTS